jgi:hypothetical protein
MKPAEQAPDVLSKGAEEAFQDLLQFSKKVQNKENLAANEEKAIKQEAHHPSLDAVVEGECLADVNFSDDESFLVQCSQALDNLETSFGGGAAGTPPEAEESDLVENFGRSDSFDDIMSQLDSEELQAETQQLLPTDNRSCRTDAGKGDRVEKQVEPLRPFSCSAESPVSAKAVKRFKSSDAGIPAKVWGSSSSSGGAGSIRRVHSSPTIPASAPQQPPKCSAAEIDRKRQEARKKRELSQIMCKRV